MYTVEPLISGHLPTAATSLQRPVANGPDPINRIKKTPYSGHLPITATDDWSQMVAAIRGSTVE